jgi:WD40 repeat protein
VLLACMQVWDMRSGDLLFGMQPSTQPFGGAPGSIKCLALVTMPNQNTFLASAGKDTAIRIWNIRTG